MKILCNNQRRERRGNGGVVNVESEVFVKSLEK